jgi:hypothetical protein
VLHRISPRIDAASSVSGNRFARNVAAVMHRAP